MVSANIIYRLTDIMELPIQVRFRMSQMVPIILIKKYTEGYIFKN
jgi:hypothetical protein